jgi:hypothetical protein
MICVKMEIKKIQKKKKDPTTRTVDRATVHLN